MNQPATIATYRLKAGTVSTGGSPEVIPYLVYGKGWGEVNPGGLPLPCKTGVMQNCLE